MSENQKDNFATRLRLVLGMLGITYKDISDRTGLHENTFYQINSKGRTPSFDTLQTIKEYYPMISLDYLIIGKGPVLLDKKYMEEMETAPTTIEEREVSYGVSNSNSLIAKAIREQTLVNKEMLEFFRSNTPIKS